MDHELLLVDVIQAFHQHLEQVFGVVFLQLPSLPYIAEQVTTLTQFHHEANVLVRLKRIIQLHHTVMSTLLKDRQLLHNSPFLLLLVP